MSALATVRAAPGLDAYLDVLELRLERAVGSHPGLVGADRRRDARGRRQAAAAGARLPRRSRRSSAAASARSRPARRSSSSTWRRSSTTTCSTARRCGAATRRSGRRTAPAAARATGDYLFARAFAELAATGDADAVALLAGAALALARGEALQRRQATGPTRPSRSTCDAAR